LAAIWRGLAFLLRGRNAEAREVLEKGLASMQRADRMLEVPTAACYLAEACWRLGDEDASDEAAALAIRVAEERGTIHLLLAALSDVPAVAVRGADTEASRLSRWHELTAMLTNSGEIVVAARSPRLVLEDLGEPVIRLDGAPVVPRLRKSVELLAYLLAAPDRAASRQELLDALFDSRNEAAGRSYLRQALYRLREVLPPELGPVLDGDRFRLPAPDLVVSRSVEVLAAFDRAGRQNAENRIETLRVALAQTERGSHLQGMSGSWIGDRGAEIAERILRARLDLAREAFQLGRYREATENVDAVLRQDPFREHAWLLRLSLAQASGNDDHVLALYQRYVATMSELEVPPSAEVHRLVTQLRR
jgi:DNA-binding SARP family transcriptional activator